MNDLTERLLNPMWCHSTAPFENPQLAKEETLADMAEAASYIAELEAQIDKFGKVTPQQYERELADLRSQVEEVETLRTEIAELKANNFSLSEELEDKRALVERARQMRHAIDMIEGALMGCGDLLDLPGAFENARDDLKLTSNVTLGEVRRVCKATQLCNDIVNSEEFDAFCSLPSTVLPDQEGAA